MPKNVKYRWKGKWVSEITYKKRIKQSENCLRQNAKSKSADDIVNDFLEGRRIIELVFAKQMWCVSCKEALSLEYIENEIRKGLGSTLSVRCHKCLLLNTVRTSKQHVSTDGHTSRFDVNAKAVIGVLHGGIGWTHLNKLLSCLNIPSIDFKTYKRYEQEVGQAVETTAKESCHNAANLERCLTLENQETIEKLLPDNLKSGFIASDEQSNLLNNEMQKDIETSPTNTTFNDVVRLAVSYDMGWSRRGTGRSYDSLNEFGAIIGNQSGLVLDYSTCNRKCKKCDNRRSPADHDCRLNFWGSAKAMEPHVGKNLVTNSSILQSKNLEVGILIGDDDSSTIAACRSSSSHPIVKHSDKNHASAGVKKQLYGIGKNCKELNNDRILYLHRCFTYALAQNKGNSAALAEAIRCIPYHAFNDHSKCGSWCGYIQNPENYDHRTVPGGFHDLQLFENLKEIFNKLALNASKFSANASSNANESLNAVMASKAPKARCYSLSQSADFRFACAIGQKNLGEGYTQDAIARLSLFPGKFHSKYVSRINHTMTRRQLFTKSREFKKKRITLKKHRSALRHRKENAEGVTYESNCTLLTIPATQEQEINKNVINDSDIEKENIILIDLETSGFGKNSEILQIAAKCGSSTFATYVQPTQQISAAATEANGLRNYCGTLMYHGVEVSSVPLRVAMGNFLNWLVSFKKCYIAAHNLNFDGPKLYDAIKLCNLQSDFSETVHGFIDTLSVIRKHTSRKGKGQCTVVGLANWLNLSSSGAHNAIYDVDILDKILQQCKISKDILINSAKNLVTLTTKWDENIIIRNSLATLDPLKAILSDNLRKKMVKASITIELLKNVYNTSGSIGVSKLLGKKENNKVIITNRKQSIEKIMEWLKEN